MGRWSMYRRRGSSSQAAGLLILTVVNTGNDTDFLVTWSAPVDATDLGDSSALTIDGEPPVDVTQDTATRILVTVGVAVSPNGTWSLNGPFFNTTPALFPQTGSY